MIKFFFKVTLSFLQQIFTEQLLYAERCFYSNFWEYRTKCVPSGKLCSRECWLLSCVWLFVTLWTVAHQIPLSMGSSRQGYWSGLPFPFPFPYFLMKKSLPWLSPVWHSFFNCLDISYSSIEDFFSFCSAGTPSLTSHLLCLSLLVHIHAIIIIIQ